MEKISEKIPTFLKKFAQKHGLDQSFTSKIMSYGELLHDWNIKKTNLTAKRNVNEILQDLCQESLKIFDFVNIASLKGIADIGSGSGILGIVLKIASPETPVFLVEVNLKKKAFLEHAIKELELQNIEVVDIDWRTFTKKTDLEIDCFVTRATFDDKEICRMFRSTSFYKDKMLFYWASSLWRPCKETEMFVQKCFEYTCGSKKRQLVLFTADMNSKKQFLVTP